MKIALSEIKGMDRRVRKSQSPEKLEELADSLREMGGVIVPIKVRKNGSGYTLVYGHRRVAAAKMAGFKDIEAFVADVPEDRLLTQALVENVVREDMAAIDIAKALQTIIEETGCTQEALAKKMGWTQSRISNYLGMLAPELGLTSSKTHRPGDISEHHVREAKTGTDNLQDAAKVLKYAGEKELSARDTRQVAEVVRRAAEFGGEKAVRKVLAQPAAQILASAPSIRKPHPKIAVHKLAGRVVFQWLKDPQTRIAEDAIGAARSVVAMVSKGERDPKGGKAWLRQMRPVVKRLLDEIDRGIGRL